MSQNKQLINKLNEMGFMYKVIKQNRGYIIKNPKNNKETIAWSFVGKTPNLISPKSFMGKKTNTLMAFNVNVKFRRMGFAKMLLKEIIKKEKINGKDYLILGVEKNNLVAIELYKNSGFVIDGEFNNHHHYMYLKL